MSDTAIQFHGIWKKFSKGEKYDSLRDLIPSLVKRLVSGNHRAELEKREFWALKDVSFDVGWGEALGIIGHNGSGKSTTLKLLSGILVPNRGSVQINGKLSALIEVGAGFHPDLTGRENIYLNAAIFGMSRRQIGAKFDEIVAFSELEEFLDTPVKRYSSGMYARLGFAVAAHLDPQILLVDEVLSVGDLAFQAKCIDRIKQLRSNNTTIVFISHNLEAVLDLCPRAILLEHGVVAMEGETRDVVNSYRARSPYRPEYKDGAPGEEKQVTVRNVVFLDQQGNETSTFRSGEKFRIRITVEAFQTIPRPVIGIAYYSERGACLYGHNSKTDGWEVGDIEGLAQFEVEYDTVLLQPGLYRVTVAVFETSAMRAYVYRDRTYSFTVQGMVGLELGVIQIPHAWKKQPVTETTTCGAAG